MIDEHNTYTDLGEDAHLAHVSTYCHRVVARQSVMSTKHDDRRVEQILSKCNGSGCAYDAHGNPLENPDPHLDSSWRLTCLVCNETDASVGSSGECCKSFLYCPVYREICPEDINNELENQSSSYRKHLLNGQELAIEQGCLGIIDAKHAKEIDFNVFIEGEDVSYQNYLQEDKINEGVFDRAHIVKLLPTGDIRMCNEEFAMVPHFATHFPMYAGYESDGNC